MIVAHLGNGTNLCAMRSGRSIDTTMGFTALDGLVMGTRCGSTARCQEFAFLGQYVEMPEDTV